jgi:hypothetical protein
MTRMISKIPYPTPLKKEHFKYARMILENKFLIGMGYDIEETLYNRIKLYFGWRELDDKSGCEAEILKSLTIINNEATRRRRRTMQHPPLPSPHLYWLRKVPNYGDSYNDRIFMM